MKSSLNSLRQLAVVTLGLVTAVGASFAVATEPAPPKRGTNVREAPAVKTSAVRTARPASTAAPTPAPAAVVPVTEPLALSLVPASDGDIRFNPTLARNLTVGDVIAIGTGIGVTERYEILDARRERGQDRWWRLVSLDHADGVGTLASRGDMFAGWLQSPAFGDAFEWTLEPMGRGRMRPTAKASDMPGCGGTLTMPDGPDVETVRDAGIFGPQPPEAPAENLARFGDEDELECASCAASIADLAFFYTPPVLAEVEAALIGEGEDPDDAPLVIATKCVLECANTTQAMENSDLAFGVRAVLVAPVDWENEDSGEILSLFAGVDDGVMDEIHLIRADVGADACSLITNSSGGGGYCGVAYLGTGDSPGSAFNNLLWGCMGYTLLAHEFGHNIGCCHAAGDGGGCGEPTDCVPWEPTVFECCRPDETGPASEAPSWNHGWRWINEVQFPACRRTLMAYGPGAVSLNYSNPEVQLAGVATGSPEDDPGNRWADNASVIRQTMPGTVAYFCEVPEQVTTSGRLVASSLGAFDGFGGSITTDGVRMFTGASRHDALGENAGAVYGFVDAVDDVPDVGWFQDAKFSPSDLEEGDRFGESVSAWEDMLVIGAPYSPRIVTEINDEGEEEVVETIPLAGRAEIWVNQGGGYCRVQVLQPDTLLGNDFFGSAVAVAGDLVAVGAPLQETATGEIDSGMVYVYQRTSTTTFELLEIFEGVEAGDRFGSTLALSVLPDSLAQGLLVGAPFSGGELGSVAPYAFFRSEDVFVVSAGPVVNGIYSGGRFGAALAIYEDKAVIGAPLARGTLGAAGAYRFVADELVQVEVLATPGLELGDNFGASVACSGTRIAVGIPGRDRMSPVDPDEVLLENVGAVAVFGLIDDDDWSAIEFIGSPQDLRAGDEFGGSVAIVGSQLFAGAPDADDAGILSGVVYALFIRPFTDCNENGIDDSVDIFLGNSTDLDGDGVPDDCLSANCDADFNGDELIDGADLGILFVSWGPCQSGSPDEPCLGDLNGDAVVDGADFGIFFLSWGASCPPDTP
ncbi:MAG: hypothetical protein CMJ23_08420 [Phycisphaerae bacterium]|nr:hypothetical protein [Phycisphaerae bacterium]